MKRKWILICAFALAASLLGGCGSRTVVDMYKIPRRTAEYNNLQTAIDREMHGLTFASPGSGDNQQNLQMADLTGNGKDECVVFAKGDGETPMKILVFTQDPDGSYRLLETIESNGAAFEQVEYVDMDGKPGCEIVAGRRMNNRLMRIVSVYSFAEEHVEQLLSAIYTRFLTCDLNSDRVNELMILRHGDADSNLAAAVLYSYKNGTMERSREAELSDRLESIKRVSVGNLQSGNTAVYISSAIEEEEIITDIFAMKDNMLVNLATLMDVETNTQMLNNQFIYPEDVDEDGVVELPELISAKAVGVQHSDEKQSLMRWYAVDLSGASVNKMCSFHDYEAGWYLQLNRQWMNRIAVEHSGNTYSFYMWSEDFREAVTVCTIYALTGRNRDTEASEQNRFALSRGDQVVYAAKLETGSAMYGITEEYLRNNFHLIRMDLKSGET